MALISAIFMLSATSVVADGSDSPRQLAGEGTNMDDIEKGLVGYWKLQGDCRDCSGKGNHGANYGANLTAEGKNGVESTAAEFNGSDSYIEIEDSQSLDFATGDFSLSAWIHTEQGLGDTIGDILSKYDPDSRKGFNFCVVDDQPRTSSNRRNLLFGIDNDKMSQWTDSGNCAGPGLSVGVFSLCVHKGKLYAGPYIRNNGAYSPQNPQGHVYRYEGGTKWTDCGQLDNSSNVLCMASYGGDLYGGVGFAEGEGDFEGEFVGKVFRYDEDSGKWFDCGQLGNSLRVECMTVFDGKLYAGIYRGKDRSGKDTVYRYEGGTKWTVCETNLGSVVSLGVYDGSLYMTCGLRVLRYEGGTEWTDCESPTGETIGQTWSFATYYGKLFVGTFPSGRVYRYEGGSEWTDCGRLEEEPGTEGPREVMALSVYNGKLYGSLWPTGEVFRYDGGTAWTHIGSLGKRGRGSSIDWHTGSEGFLVSGLDGEMPPRYAKCYNAGPGVSRTPALAVYGGMLYAGTWNWEFDLPGHVYSIEAGKGVTYDHELEPGWKHLTVVKDADTLILYIDGELKASSSSFDPKDYNISNDETMKIGFGAHDYFKGKMSQVRAYNRALTGEEIERLFTSTEKSRAH